MRIKEFECIIGKWSWLRFSSRNSSDQSFFEYGPIHVKIINSDDIFNFNYYLPDSLTTQINLFLFAMIKEPIVFILSL